MNHDELLKFVEALSAENVCLRKENRTLKNSKCCDEPMIKAALAKEREWVAYALERQCDNMSDYFDVRWMREVAKAIRARGQNEPQ